MYFVYVLRSLAKNTFYVGITDNVRRRLLEHNSGSSTHTRKYMPWELIYFEAYETKSLAAQREKALKNHAKGFQELKKRILGEKGEG